MGNDGGSIPDRRDLVRNKPKAEQADKANQTKARWLYCAYQRKLQEPVYLLDKSAYGDGEKICGHIRSLKDVKKLNLTPNPAPLSTDASNDATDQMNGVQPFVYLATCGCVFSLAGLKAVAATSSPKDKAKEDEEKTAEDIVTLNPSPEEEETMRFALERKRLLEPSKKKSKKRKNDASPDEELNHRQRSMLSSQTGRAVVNELAKEEAKRKANMSAAVKSLYGDGSKRKETFMTMGTFTR
ncbi:DUF602-domain-containing protein, partial [Pholiota molesta]